MRKKAKPEPRVESSRVEPSQLKSNHRRSEVGLTGEKHQRLPSNQSKQTNPNSIQIWDFSINQISNIRVRQLEILCSDEIEIEIEAANSMASGVVVKLEASASISDNLIGLILAIASSAFIGSSFIIKKKGLKRAAASGNSAGTFFTFHTSFDYHFV